MVEINKDIEKKHWWQPAVQLLVQISAWIVGPILAALFLGDFLEQRFGHEPWPTIILIAIAFIITNIGLVKQTIKVSKKIESEIKKEKEEKSE